MKDVLSTSPRSDFPFLFLSSRNSPTTPPARAEVAKAPVPELAEVSTSEPLIFKLAPRSCRNAPPAHRVTTVVEFGSRVALSVLAAAMSPPTDDPSLLLDGERRRRSQLLRLNGVKYW